MTPAKDTGQIRLPTGRATISLVSRVDVADCLTSLATQPPTGAVHQITGPERLDLTAMAQHAAARYGTPIEGVDVTPHKHHVEMAIDGTEPWWAYAYSSMFSSIRQQRWSRVTNAVANLTGHVPASSRIACLN